MTDDEIRAKLHAMWTPELWDKIKAGARARLEASPQYKDQSAEERDAALESMMQQTRERFDAWPPKPMPGPMVALMGEEIIEDEFKAALRAHVLHRVGEETIASKVAMGMPREMAMEGLLTYYAKSNLGERLKAYHAEHGRYPEVSGFSHDVPSDLVGEVKALAWRMAEFMCDQHGEDKVIPMTLHLPDFVQHIRDFYSDHGQLPVIKKGDPWGCVMGTGEEMESEPG